MEVLTMPWKEVNIMNQRLEFVLKSLENDINFTELSTEYCITPKTGYKWKERFIKNGISGLLDKPRRPVSCPKRLSEETICEIIRTKQIKMYWGAKKIRLVYARNNPHVKPPSVSTIERILKRAGFVEIRKRRRRVHPERIQNFIVPEKPNDVWTVDFKGWWYTSEQERCEPLTVRDEYSKYILAITILEKGDITSVKHEFSKLFKTFGLPKMIKSDNGPPFASANGVLGLTRLAAWWMSLGIKLHRIDPGSPYQNGAHERMHLDMKKELENKISGNLKLHQSVFEQWRIEFNEERPHESLVMKTPSMVYKKSEIKYDGVDDWLVYPDGFISRRVNNRGYINHMGRRIFITNALCGYNIGLKPVDKSRAEVWFEKNLLGIMDLKTFMFKSIMC
jgi:transposase InsO family protein